MGGYCFHEYEYVRKKIQNASPKSKNGNKTKNYIYITMYFIIVDNAKEVRHER